MLKRSAQVVLITLSVLFPLVSCEADIPWLDVCFGWRNYQNSTTPTRLGGTPMDCATSCQESTPYRCSSFAFRTKDPEHNHTNSCVLYDSESHLGNQHNITEDRYHLDMMGFIRFDPDRPSGSIIGNFFDNACLPMAREFAFTINLGQNNSLYLPNGMTSSNDLTCDHHNEHWTLNARGDACVCPINFADPKTCQCHPEDVEVHGECYSPAAIKIRAYGIVENETNAKREFRDQLKYIMSEKAKVILETYNKIANKDFPGKYGLLDKVQQFGREVSRALKAMDDEELDAWPALGKWYKGKLAEYANVSDQAGIPKLAVNHH